MWHNKRVIVTGSTGVIGRELVEKLLKIANNYKGRKFSF